MAHIKYPSIEQFRNAIRNIQHKTQFKGVDSNGEPIINRNATLPTLEFIGSVKLHGTNAAVVVSKSKKIWYQSRERVITATQDNAGFAAFAESKTDYWLELTNNVTGFDYDCIAIYGEWCGGNIQKNVALANLPKMFVIFDVCLISDNDTRYFLNNHEIQDLLKSTSVDADIKTIWDFKTFSVNIDFNEPILYQNQLNEITESVESECPVGKALGVSGIGEGVVWKCFVDGYRSPEFWFKVKGEAHSKSKVKTLATVDVEKYNNINELANKLANKERLAQIAQSVFDLLNGGSLDMKKTSDFIRAVIADIVKEESDTIALSGILEKDLNSRISKICVDYLKEV